MATSSEVRQDILQKYQEAARTLRAEKREITPDVLAKEMGLPLFTVRMFLGTHPDFESYDPASAPTKVTDGPEVKKDRQFITKPVAVQANGHQKRFSMEEKLGALRQASTSLWEKAGKRPITLGHRELIEEAQNILNGEITQQSLLNAYYNGLSSHERMKLLNHYHYSSRDLTGKTTKPA